AYQQLIFLYEENVLIRMEALIHTLFQLNLTGAGKVDMSNFELLKVLGSGDVYLITIVLIVISTPVQAIRVLKL
ncbi:hypothetical protein L9F63_004881, partial [Diploptera punctata]